MKKEFRYLRVKERKEKERGAKWKLEKYEKEKTIK